MRLGKGICLDQYADIRGDGAVQDWFIVPKAEKKI